MSPIEISYHRHPYHREPNIITSFQLYHPKRAAHNSRLSQPDPSSCTKMLFVAFRYSVRPERISQQFLLVGLHYVRLFLHIAAPSILKSHITYNKTPSYALQILEAYTIIAEFWVDCCSITRISIAGQ